MIILDTNVVSELMRPAPAITVEGWMGSQPAASLFISTITEAELRYGLELLPQVQRRLQLAARVETMLTIQFLGRILPFDSAAAMAYADIAATRRSAGRPISQADAQIAAIARSRGASLATRNVADFTDCGVEIIDPWNI